LDVDPVEAALLDPGSRQHGRHLRGEPLPDRAGADEVADLERPLAAAPVKPGASDLARLVWGEHTVRVVLVRVEARAKAAEKLDLLVERLRLEPRPRHPGPQAVDARGDRLLEQRRILGVVAADDEALALDPIGRRRNGHSHSIVAGGFDVTSRTTRFTAGISLTIREETSSTRSEGRRAQSAVIAPSGVTAPVTHGDPDVPAAPWTPAERAAGASHNHRQS